MGEKIILGVDPGLNITGFGVVAASGPSIRLLDAGTIRTKASDPLTPRLTELYEGIAGVIERYGPEVMGLEKVYSHYRHPTTAIIMGHARGVLCLAAGIKGIRVESIPASRVKKAVTGNGRASKAQVNGMVRRIFGIRGELKPVDVSDALAVALALYEEERHA
ncbi:MAG TPA: crossover junction endodeoxyribonuclease RuvC [Candidatus Sabulitectum sp.]|nr:crossover junction endodeoxyribonuclease RuvC [Candidatus Sabulitectum sp.]HPF31820.1 crossover junction endodeoxyribonuclease RuvC [Candidatus Sabulitectum sp.]HPJ29467.1 crossover junction endodeoxyribonuclease RuvC [Candidatus Sabulitectum sp.]HPR23006.1 crossover junction endodeoxyribonuclease RuvC [Candidatus Sabulitectum sp.]HRW77634.1 crossover junction endodeoxyribonuclease RuvC [Candidatus Sabulitectum sp.]